MQRKPIEQVLAQHRDSLMTLRGVVGVGQGLLDGQPCITVLVVDASVRTRSHIPQELDGYPVTVEVTGVIRPTGRE